MGETDVIKSMLTGITQGEWRACHDGDCPCGMVFAEGNDVLVHVPGNQEDHDRLPDDDRIKHNAKFIAAAPTIVRELLDEIDRLTKEVEHQRHTLCLFDDAYCLTEEEKKMRR